MVDTCLEQDLGTFKGSCQDMVDELEELRRRCGQAAHRARITRLLFIITRCSRLVFTGALCSSMRNHAWLLLYMHTHMRMCTFTILCRAILNCY